MQGFFISFMKITIAMTAYGIYYRHQKPYYIAVETETLDGISQQLSKVEDSGDGFAFCIITDSGKVHVINHDLPDYAVSLVEIQEAVRSVRLPINFNTLTLAEPITTE